MVAQSKKSKRYRMAPRTVKTKFVVVSASLAALAVFFAMMLHTLETFVTHEVTTNIGDEQVVRLRQQFAKERKARKEEARRRMEVGRAKYAKQKGMEISIEAQPMKQITPPLKLEPFNGTALLEKLALINHNFSIHAETSISMPSQSKQNFDNLLDAIMHNQLPKIYPARFSFNKQNRTGGAEFVLAQWTLPAQRKYGIGPKDFSEANGGVTVLGEWPDEVQSLLYVPILKNAHTSLANAVGDLRNRISTATVDVYNWDKIRQQKMKDAKQLSTKTKKAVVPVNDSIPTIYDLKLQHFPFDTSIAFTVLRDPVDRYISATCEELRQQQARMRKLCFPDNETSAEFNLECLLQELVRKQGMDTMAKQFLAHQTPQYAILYSALRGLDHAGVSVVDFRHLPQLLREVGNKNDKVVRDRMDSKYYTDQSKPKMPKTLADAVKERSKHRRLLMDMDRRKFLKKFRSGVNRRERAEDSQQQANNNGRGRDLQQKSKARQRVNDAASKSVKDKSAQMERLSKFCKLKPSDLKPIHLDIICRVYKQDVELMTKLGIHVPHCEGKAR